VKLEVKIDDEGRCVVLLFYGNGLKTFSARAKNSRAAIANGDLFHNWFMVMRGILTEGAES
jgi:hypothetical protein